MAKTPLSLKSAYQKVLNNTDTSTQTTFGDSTANTAAKGNDEKKGYYGQNYNYNSTLPNVGGTLNGNTKNCGMAVKPEVINAMLVNIQNNNNKRTHHTQAYHGFQPTRKLDALPQNPYGLAPHPVKRLNNGNLKTGNGDYGNFKQYLNTAKPKIDTGQRKQNPYSNPNTTTKEQKPPSNRWKR